MEASGSNKGRSKQLDPHPEGLGLGSVPVNRHSEGSSVLQHHGCVEGAAGPGLQ